MRTKEIAVEFARRAKAFHSEVENPMDIKMWSLFYFSDISRLVKNGDIVLNNGYTKNNKIVWCKPSLKFYEKHIKPLMNKDIETINEMAGY